MKDREKNNLQEKLRGSNRFEFEEVCHLLETKYHLQPRDLLGLGTSCWVYQYGNHNVIKICAKKIKFFHNRTSHAASELQKTAQTMTPAFLPIKEILYDGEMFFVYVQDKCQPLPKKDPISVRQLQEILIIIQTMLSHGLLVGQIKPKNVGLWKGQIVLFDYHSMHVLEQRMKSKTNWYGSLVDALNLYQTLCPTVNLKPLIETIKKTTDVHQILNQLQRLIH
jgi:hypothetical protein